MITAAIGLLLFSSACTADDASPEESATYPSPTVVNPALPVDPGNTVTSDQMANSDPCGLVNVDALAAYGEVELQRESINPWGCEATMSGGGTVWKAEISIEATLLAESVEDLYSTREHNGFTIYSGPTHDILGCPRKVVAAPDAVVDVWATSAADEAENCELADVAIEGVVAKLLAGEFPPSVMSPNSLAMQDACTLLELGEEVIHRQKLSVVNS